MSNYLFKGHRIMGYGAHSKVRQAPLACWVVSLTCSGRFFFAKKFEHILQNVAKNEAEKVAEEVAEGRRPWHHRIFAFFQGRHISVIDEENAGEDLKRKESAGGSRKLRPDMIRRMDDAPKLVNPSGWVSEGPQTATRITLPTPQIIERSSFPDISRTKAPPSPKLPVRRSLSLEERYVAFPFSNGKPDSWTQHAATPPFIRPRPSIQAIIPKSK